MDTTGNMSNKQTKDGRENEIKREPHSNWLKSVESFQARHNRKRNFSERLADAITAKSGSMMFLALNIGFFAIWIVLNHYILPEGKAIDPFPFPALTTIVSLEAIFLAIVVLISQNRQMKIQDLRQEINLHIDTLAEQEITKVMNLIQGLYDALNLPLAADSELQEMSRPTDPELIEEKLVEQTDAVQNKKDPK